MSNLALDLFTEGFEKKPESPALGPVFEIKVFGTPQPGGSKKAFQWHAKDGRSGVSVVDDNPKGKSWKTLVEQQAGEIMEGRQLFEGPLQVHFVFFVLRPKGHYGAKGNLKDSAPKWPTVRPDVLKLARLVEDSLSGIVYRDDNQIVRELLEKRYGSPERVEVSVWRAR